MDKINKLKKRLLAWQFRGLSLGGKVLVVKTFGISQLIYTMQAVEYDEVTLKEVESFIFGFLWSKNITIAKAPDRIKRSVMKQDYDAGGLKVPDIKAMNDALKLKQFFKANNSNHPIKMIQKYILELNEYDQVIEQEYSRLSGYDNVIRTAQSTLNELTDKWRNEVSELIVNDVNGSIIDLIASTKVAEYLSRKRALMSKCLFARLQRSGIVNFKQLIVEKIYPRSDSFAAIASLVVKEFPSKWEELIKANIECNSYIDVSDNIVLEENSTLSTVVCVVKQIRNRLVRERITTHKYESVLGIAPHPDLNPFVAAWKFNYSMSQRIFKFRLLHLDIFTKQRMFKFKMIEDDKCDVCGDIETIKHALWDCNRAKLVWDTLGALMTHLNVTNPLTFAHLFIGFNPPNPILETIITKLSQSLMSYERSTVINSQMTTEIILNYAHLNKNIQRRRKVDKNIIAWYDIIRWCNRT